MELQVQESAREAVVTVEGEGYTFLTLLKSALLEDNRTQSVTYSVDNFTGRKGTLRVQVKKEPREVLASAANRIVGQCNDFKKALSKGK